MKINLLVTGVSVLLYAGHVLATENDDFAKWKNKHKQEVAQFVDEYDKDFASFLKTRWIKAEVVEGEQRDSKPKPTAAPKKAPEKAPEKEPKPIVDETPVLIVPPKEPVTTKPVTTEPVPKTTPVKKDKSRFDYAKSNQAINVPLLGQTLRMPKIELPELSINSLSSNAISELWLTMAKGDFTAPVKALKQASDDLQLDDWGNALLTHKYLTAVKKLTQNERQLLTWFYMVKQGFDARVAFDKNEVYLLLNTEQALFGQKFFTFDKQKYYFVDFAKKRPINIGSVYTYEQQHSSANKKVTLDLSRAPIQGVSDKTRVLSTKVDNQKVVVKAPYNSSYVDFLDYYPQISMQYYFQAELPTQTKVALLGQLKQDINGLSELQAINFLLHFVQTSLGYQTDQEQFNYENYLFATETLHYPYADCEDRSVLFAYLVKHLLGNKVVGLQYDGHIATAVELKSEAPGDSFLVNNVKYTVADPTFINANVGEVMTMYQGVKPKFIVF